MSRFAKNLRDVVSSNRQSGTQKDPIPATVTTPTHLFGNQSTSSGIVPAQQQQNTTKPKSPDSGVSSRAQTPAEQPPKQNRKTAMVDDEDAEDGNVTTPKHSLEAAIGRIEQLNLDFTREDSAYQPTPRCFTARSRDLVGEVERLMAYVDADVVHDYLQRSNQILRSLRLWFNSGSHLPPSNSRTTRAAISTRGGNFLEFVHFWLTEFPGVERQELLRLEYENLCDELGFAFRVADASSSSSSSRDSETISRASLHRLLEVVLPEYPGELCRANGAHRFLEMLDTLCCARNVRFRSLLSRLFTPNSASARSYSTRSAASAASTSTAASNSDANAEVHPVFRKHMKWLLAIRAFAVLSFTQSPVEMFNSLQSMSNSQAAGSPTRDRELSASLSPSTHSTSFN